MAHSNRKKLKEARGGMTRNQQRKAKKAQNSSGQANRLAETLQFIAENEQKRLNKTVVTAKKEEKVVRYAKDKRTVKRRRRVIDRLTEQLTLRTKQPKGFLERVELTPADTARINKELTILKSRV